jgi:hypothetical protein
MGIGLGGKFYPHHLKSRRPSALRMHRPQRPSRGLSRARHVSGSHSYRHQVIYEDGETIAFLNRYPTLLGYCLVAPRRHAEDWVRELDEAEWTLTTAARRLSPGPSGATCSRAA